MFRDLDGVRLRRRLAAVFSVWPCLFFPAARRVGGVPRALGLSFLVVGALCGWSAGGVGLQAGDRGGELTSPGPGRGEPQPQAAAAAHLPPGGGEQAQPQPFAS
jgi:hypothetical protein